MTIVSDLYVYFFIKWVAIYVQGFIINTVCFMSLFRRLKNQNQKIRCYFDQDLYLIFLSYLNRNLSKQCYIIIVYRGSTNI